MTSEQKTIYGKEYGALSFKQLQEPDFYTLIQPLIDSEKERVLGLHYNSKDSRWQPGDYIGAVWLSEERKIAFSSTPKFPSMDYLKMFCACAEDPVVSEHLDNDLFYCWPDEPGIEIEDKNDLSILLIAIFLQTTHRLCQRHLRRNFIREEENFIGKAKGRILLSTHIRQNVARAREDRIYCQFQTISDDCRENQILRTALEQASRFLARQSGNSSFNKLWEWVHTCRAALYNVQINRITPDYFQGLKYSGSFIHYREPHNYAKMIFSLLGPDPSRSDTEDIVLKKNVPPFALSSFELFERYCEVKLREAGFFPPELWVGYDNRPEHNLGGARPDFLICGQGHKYILDAKYKERADKDDIIQMCWYSRNSEVLKQLGLSSDGCPEKIIFLYPSIQKVPKQIELTKSARDYPYFDKIHKLFVSVPKK